MRTLHINISLTLLRRLPATARKSHMTRLLGRLVRPSCRHPNSPTAPSSLTAANNRQPRNLAICHLTLLYHCSFVNLTTTIILYSTVLNPDLEVLKSTIMTCADLFLALIAILFPPIAGKPSPPPPLLHLLLHLDIHHYQLHYHHHLAFLCSTYHIPHPPL